MCTKKGFKVNLEHGEIKLSLEVEGVRGANAFVRGAVQLFLDSIDNEEETQEDNHTETAKEEVLEQNKGISSEDLMEHLKQAYIEVDTAIKEDKMKKEDYVSKKEEIDYELEFSNSDVDKFEREYTKIKDVSARNLYHKLIDNMINQLSYFVTDKGDLKLQARYSCKCGNFRKHWVAYPTGKKNVRCNSCGKENILMLVNKNNFPSTDEFGNFYITSNMLKRAEEKKN